jgi:hypothetical protein
MNMMIGAAVIAAAAEIPAAETSAEAAAAASVSQLGLPMPTDASNASPELRSACLALHDAGEALTAAQAAFNIENDRAAEWREQNPAPLGDKLAMRRWKRIKRKYRAASGIDETWDAQLAAEETFRAAQFAVAKIEPRDMRDLALMCGCSHERRLDP